MATSLVVGKLAATKEAESADIQRIFPTLLIPTAIVILLLMELGICGKKIPLIKGITVQKKVQESRLIIDYSYTSAVQALILLDFAKVL